MRTANSIHEIILINPINNQRITTALETIKHDNSDYLLIDSGAHEFASIRAMKFLRDRLTGMETLLRRYQKIALIHPQNIVNFSEEPWFFQYFSRRDNAIAWFNVT